MKKILFSLAFAPVFLLASVFTFSVPSALACCVDIDGDGYGIASLPECPVPNVLDCDDDTGDDLPICATCTCDQPDCTTCAKCINPGVIEEAFGDPMCQDGVDNDCNDLIDMNDPGCFECTGEADCDDGNACTDDLCVENACVHENNTAPCDDLDDCTMGEACSLGQCVGGLPPDEDEDTFVSEDCGGEDCDDLNPNVHPGVMEGPPEDPVCMDDIDNNCNGWKDLEDVGCLPGGWSPAEPVAAAVYGAPTREGSNFSNLFFALLLPIGAVILLRRVLTKR